MTARIEEAGVSRLDGGGRGLRLTFEVGEIGLAERALDDFDMEDEIVGEVGFEDIEKKAAELLAARAGQAGASPDCP